MSSLASHSEGDSYSGLARCCSVRPSPRPRIRRRTLPELRHVSKVGIGRTSLLIVSFDLTAVYSRREGGLCLRPSPPEMLVRTVCTGTYRRRSAAGPQRRARTRSADSAKLLGDVDTLCAHGGSGITLFKDSSSDSISTRTALLLLWQPPTRSS
jgi:hypothetical protein